MTGGVGLKTVFYRYKSVTDNSLSPPSNLLTNRSRFSTSYFVNIAFYNRRTLSRKTFRHVRLVGNRRRRYKEDNNNWCENLILFLSSRLLGLLTVGKNFETIDQTLNPCSKFDRRIDLLRFEHIET